MIIFVLGLFVCKICLIAQQIAKKNGQSFVLRKKNWVLILNIFNEIWDNAIGIFIIISRRENSFFHKKLKLTVWKN